MVEIEKAIQEAETLRKEADKASRRLAKAKVEEAAKAVGTLKEEGVWPPIPGRSAPVSAIQ